MSDRILQRVDAYVNERLQQAGDRKTEVVITNEELRRKFGDAMPPKIMQMIFWELLPNGWFGWPSMVMTQPQNGKLWMLQITTASDGTDCLHIR